jgi:hypothetical protein
VICNRSRGIVKVVTCRRVQWARHVARLGETRNACRILAGETHEKLPLRRSIMRWEDHTQIGYEDGKWMELAQDRVQWQD